MEDRDGGGGGGLGGGAGREGELRGACVHISCFDVITGRSFGS